VKRSDKVGLSVTSLIIGLLMVMNKKQLSKGSTINYLNYMRKATSGLDAPAEDRLEVAKISREAMLLLVDQFKGTSDVVLETAVFVESLSFSFQRDLEEFCGYDYMLHMTRFVNKQDISDEVRSSYKLSDQLRDNIRKLVFDASS